MTRRPASPSIQTYPVAAHANTGTVLDRILILAVPPSSTAKKFSRNRAQIRRSRRHTLRDFPAALSRDALNVIAELKPASPSRGVIRDPFDASALAKSLEAAGAAALSVLTEAEFFGGTLKNLRDARKKSRYPCCARILSSTPGKSGNPAPTTPTAFLLIVAALCARLRELLALGRELKMEPLVEVHTRQEFDRALAAGAKIIGVNNRDLKTLTVRSELLSS